MSRFYSKQLDTRLTLTLALDLFSSALDLGIPIFIHARLFKGKWAFSEFSHQLLTLIRESWKQNPKPGNVTQRHLWKQNPDKIKIFDFGNVTQRHFWKQNPEHFHEHLFITFNFFKFWERHPTSFLETKSRQNSKF